MKYVFRFLKMDVPPLLPEPALDSNDLIFFVHIKDLRDFEWESDQHGLREAIHRSYQLKEINKAKRSCWKRHFDTIERINWGACAAKSDRKSINV